MQGTARGEVDIAGKVGRDVTKILDLVCIDRADQPFFMGLSGEGGVDRHDVIGTWIGAQLGQHLHQQDDAAEVWRRIWPKRKSTFKFDCVV
jgi:hypothetical protein